MKRFTLLSLLLAGAVSSYAAEPAAVAPKGDAATGQGIATTVCAACHGPDGNSVGVPNPKLAGQHADYLFKQLKDFKAAGDKPPQRLNPIMNAMVMAYDEAQMRDLAAYFASQTQIPDKARGPEGLALGRRLYVSGDAAKGIPACAACHGPAGAGIPAQYPRVAGQFADYIDAQLKLFREGTRANDPNGMMRMVAVKMTDAEIKVVADFIAELR